MGSFVIYFSQLTNTPSAPFIFPCYHCQVVQNKIPLRYRPLHTRTLSPASLPLQLHFNLEDLHFEHHPTSSSTYWTHKTDIQQLVSLSSNRETFIQLLSRQWSTNCEILRLFLAEPGSPSVTVTNKRTIVADCLTLDADLCTNFQKHLRTKFMPLFDVGNKNHEHLVNFLLNSP